MPMNVHVVCQVLLLQRIGAIAKANTQYTLIQFGIQESIKKNVYINQIRIMSKGSIYYRRAYSPSQLSDGGLLSIVIVLLFLNRACKVANDFYPNPLQNVNMVDYSVKYGCILAITLL